MWVIAVMVLTISGQPMGNFTFVPDKFSTKEACEAFRASDPFKLAMTDFMKDAKAFLEKKNVTEELVALANCTAKGTDI